MMHAIAESIAPSIRIRGDAGGVLPESASLMAFWWRGVRFVSTGMGLTGECAGENRPSPRGVLDAKTASTPPPAAHGRFS